MSVSHMNIFQCVLEWLVSNILFFHVAFNKNVAKHVFITRMKFPCHQYAMITAPLLSTGYDKYHI